MSRIETLKEKITIEDLAQKLGVLDGAKRENGEWKLCCLFHDEKTPSMFIIPKKQRYYCFGCAAGGDILDLFMHVKGIGERRQAIMELEDMYGIEPLPYEGLRHYKRKPEPDEAGYTSEKYGHEHWRMIATSNAMKGHRTPEFWAWWQKRGWSLPTLTQLAAEEAIGWAPVKKGSAKHALHFLFERGIKCRSKLESSKSNWWKEGKARDCAWRVEKVDQPRIENVVIMEGETDTISLLDEHPEDPKTVYLGAPGASWHPNPLLTWRIGNGRNIILIGDNDEAGTNFCFRLRKLFREECDDCEVSRIKWNQYPGFGPGAGVDEALHSSHKLKLLTDLRSRCE